MGGQRDGFAGDDVEFLHRLDQAAWLASDDGRLMLTSVRHLLGRLHRLTGDVPGLLPGGQAPVEELADLLDDVDLLLDTHRPFDALDAYDRFSETLARLPDPRP